MVDDNCALQFWDDNKFLCHQCVDGSYFGLEWESYNCKFDLDDCSGTDCGTSYYSVMDATNGECGPGYYGTANECTACP